VSYFPSYKCPERVLSELFPNIWAIGGGIINMKEKWVVIMLFSLILLPLSLSPAGATDPINADQSSAKDSLNNTTLLNTAQQKDSTDQQTTDFLNQPRASYPSKQNSAIDGYAAGETATTHAAAISVTQSQLEDAATNVKNFIEKNKRLPNYVTIAGTQVSVAQFLQLVSDGLLNINSGKNTTLVIKDVANPTSPSESIKSGTIQNSEYVKLATNLDKFITDKGRAPNYLSSSLGNIRYESLVYMFSRIISFNDANGRLPTYVTVTSWSSQTGTTTGSLSKYLQPTANCQSTSSTIKSRSASITSGISSTYSKAQAIFNWVKNNLSYSYYYDTKKGALGALSSRSANCCDHSHLVIALARAAGIPGRYIHVSGHVYSQLYANGVWYNADAINNSNYFGQAKSSNNILGIYAELPF
jgi:hypothetical protein